MARYRLTQEYDDLGPLATDLVDYFHDVHRFHFIKSLHSPAGGALLCVRRGRRAHPGGKEKKIVVKHGINDFRADEIPGETHILEALRGAQHICQLLALRHDVIPDGDERAYANAWWAYDEFPLVWENPYMVLEAISNGTLDDFIKKNEGNPMSQDMLWILFLCLIRSCIAMAYPPYGEPGVTPTRERIKPGVEKSGISHSDMHGGNIMFGDAWEDDEHYGCNPLRVSELV
ncbi:hypothetical protein F4810DRAFT_631930 [Camillea tinctor]|nr:hypothetical protein F4810DRAFT_631930 [Camillea tinctor]